MSTQTINLDKSTSCEGSSTQPESDDDTKQQKSSPHPAKVRDNTTASPTSNKSPPSSTKPKASTTTTPISHNPRPSPTKPLANTMSNPTPISPRPFKAPHPTSTSYNFPLESNLPSTTLTTNTALSAPKSTSLRPVHYELPPQNTDPNFLQATGKLPQHATDGAPTHNAIIGP